LPHSGKLFATVYIYSFLYAALWFNQVLSSVKKLNSPLCCKPAMQTYCGLTNCSGNSPQTGFPFHFGGLLVTTTDQFRAAQRQVENSVKRKQLRL